MRAYTAVAGAVLLASGPASAEVAVVAVDAKQRLVDGVATNVENAPADTAVVIDLAAGMPDAADLEPYSQAFLVLRYRGVPFGHTWLPVTSGYLPASALSAAALSVLSQLNSGSSRPKWP